MRTTLRKRIRWSLSLLLGVAVLQSMAGVAGSAPLSPSSRGYALRPILHPSMGAARQANGSAKAQRLLADVTIDLCATTGTLTMPDATVVTVWGLVAPDPDCAAVSGTASVPGPRIQATEGEVVQVNVTNDLSENVSLMFPGQSLAPDMVGVANGDTATYTFTATSPGTFLYEAGANATVQVPMGMFGALIVRPTAGGQAYDDPSTAFDEQATLILSEVDPALNNAADPDGFEFTQWAPRYWLINGRAYDPDNAGPSTIAVGAGDTLLLRYLNAGLDHHTMTLLGTYQREIASDAFPLPFPFDVVSETIPAGQTKDMLVASLPAGRYPLYSANLNVTNANFYPGGMLAFIVAS
jgi:FtsP/CotA-like multicopper oxidase with cupredoxin domain